MICIDCVTPKPLKNYVRVNGERHVCKYCGQNGQSVEDEALFRHILNRVDENVAVEEDLSFYELGMLYECGSDEISVSGIDIVLAEWMELGEEKYFDELMGFVPREYLVGKNGNEKHFYFDDGSFEQNLYDVRWSLFVQNISHSHRFFNVKAEIFLAEVFAFLTQPDGKLKPACARTMHPGEEVYRARVAKTPAEVKRMKESPAAEFASPPKDRASSQRMTPIGIPALYCAFERETCLSEIRSITGDHVVSIALTPTREIRLLDLTKLEDIDGPNLSLLDEGRRKAVNLRTFIRSLVQKMSRPKARNDELSYLSTQVVFEYLSLRFASQVQGLVFPSVQTGEQGLNVVFFPESSKISTHPYLQRDDAEPDFGAIVQQAFEAHATLAYIANSFKFHKVKAIITVAETFESSALLYMSDLDKQRLGIH